MSLTILPSHAYALIAGLCIGKFTNLFSDVVITGLVLYIVTPEIFTEDRLNRAKNYFRSWFKTNSFENSLTQEQQKLLLNSLNSLAPDQKELLLTQGQLIINPQEELNKRLVLLPKIEILTSPKATLH